MSGGHYHYAYSTMRCCADMMEDDVRQYATEHVDRWGDTRNPIPPDILDLMRQAAVTLLRDAQMARDIEWYMSGDYGDDTLRECAKSWALRAVPPDEQPPADEGKT